MYFPVHVYIVLFKHKKDLWIFKQFQYSGTQFDGVKLI